MSFLENIIDWLNEQPLMNKLAILIVLVLIISGLYWYFVWSPNNDLLKGFQKTLQTKRKKLNELENIKADLPKFIAGISSIFA